MKERYLIYRASARTGLGHILVSTMNAAWRARELGRVFVPDMTSFPYASGNRHEAFFECFELIGPPDLRMITDQAEMERLRSLQDRRYAYEQVHLDTAEDRPEQVILVRGGMLKASYRLAEKTRPAAMRLRLRGWLAEAVEPQLAALRAGPPRVGVYFRHGQGEFLRGRLDQVLFPEHDQLYAELRGRYPRRALEVAAAAGLERPAFFVSSDSEAFVRETCAALPNATAFSGVRPDRNFKEHLVASKQDPAILASAVQDMWGLSHCRAVLAMDSLFPHFAALNSETLGEADMHDIGAPTFVSFLDSLPPDEALERAEQAYWGSDSLLTAGIHARALRRLRLRERADHMQRRAEWHREMIIDVALRNADLDATERRGRDAVAALREFDWNGPPNPYALALMASVLLQDGDLPAAEQALRRAMWVDPGISRVNALLAQLRARQGDRAGALAAARAAASAGRLDPTTAELMNRLMKEPDAERQAA